MNDIPSNAQRGCTSLGCIVRFAALFMILYAAWGVPYLFSEEIEAHYCPEGTELRIYDSFFSFQSGEGCFDVNTDEKVKDLRKILFLYPMTVMIVGVVGLILIHNLFVPLYGQGSSESIPISRFKRYPELYTPSLGDIIGQKDEVSPAPPRSRDDVRNQRLVRLSEALNSGLITQADYDQKREEILKQFDDDR